MDNPTAGLSRPLTPITDSTASSVLPRTRTVGWSEGDQAQTPPRSASNKVYPLPQPQPPPSSVDNVVQFSVEEHPDHRSEAGQHVEDVRSPSPRPLDTVEGPPASRRPSFAGQLLAKSFASMAQLLAADDPGVKDR